MTTFDKGPPDFPAKRKWSYGSGNDIDMKARNYVIRCASVWHIQSDHLCLTKCAARRRRFHGVHVECAAIRLTRKEH